MKQRRDLPMNATLLRNPQGRVAYPLDACLSLSVALLLSLGCVFVYSASTETALLKYGEGHALLLRHLVYLTLALAAGLCLLLVPVRLLHRVRLPALLIALLLLVLVLVPGVGMETNGATRWIRLGPLGSVQASEVAKLACMLFFAGYLAEHHRQLLRGGKGLLLPLALLGLLTLLLLLEPDFGATVVLLVAVLGMLFLAGAPLSRFLPLLLALPAALMLLLVQEPYRLERLISFADPWEPEHRFSSGYQLTQALIAFGRGEWWGLGLGNSIQKLFFLPEAHTDFVFSVLAEELGATGSILLICLCLLVVWRALVIGRRAHGREQLFAAFLAYGLGLLLGVQMLINLGVNLGSLPTKGLTLPFVSYGGNSLIVCVAAVAILLRIDHENRAEGRT